MAEIFLVLVPAFSPDNVTPSKKNRLPHCYLWPSRSSSQLHPTIDRSIYVATPLPPPPTNRPDMQYCGSDWFQNDFLSDPDLATISRLFYDRAPSPAFGYF
jgi:hypothetical protein